MRAAWFVLAASVISDVIGCMLVRQMDGLRRPFILSGVVVAYLMAMSLFIYSMKFLPLGPAFAIWSGAGMVLIALTAIWLYGETPDLAAIIGMTFIILGVVVMSLFSKMEVH
jgi:small multidrug resistance pump